MAPRRAIGVSAKSAASDAIDDLSAARVVVVRMLKIT
jgi:hypothetical protein